MEKNINMPFQPEDIDSIVDTLSDVTKRWVDTPYYNKVEKAAQQQWDNLISPFIQNFPINYENVLELAIGHGRITNILLKLSNNVIGVDVLEENIEFCAERFKTASNLTLIKNDGVTLKGVDSESVSFVICFDSMVHFDSDVIRVYLGEFERILKPGGYAFLHHSNFSKSPEGDFNRAPHARNFMSEQLFKHYAFKSGLKVVKSQVISWGSKEKRIENLDCLSLVEKPKAE